MSGSDIAAWFCLCGLVMDGEQPVLVDGTPDVRFFLIPAAQVEVLDTWSDVQGLRGSGSNAVQVVPTVVPQRHPSAAGRMRRPEIATHETKEDEEHGICSR